jgi:hypothetical protein
VSRRPVAAVTVLKLPHLHPDAIRVEIECRYSMTGLTSIPGPMFALGAGAGRGTRQALGLDDDLEGWPE